MTEALLDHPLIGARYFFPRAEPPRVPFWVEVPGARLACLYHRGDPQGLTVVHFHGNGEVVADYQDDFPAAFARLGCNLLLAEYRGYGASSGRPQLGRMLDDVGPLLASLGLPPRRLVLFGRSVGALFAVHGVSLLPQVAGLILESGVADVLERLQLRVRPEELGVTAAGLAAAVADRLDQRAKLAAYRGPVLVLHAVHDSLVAAGHGERLSRWAGGSATLRLFSRGDHNDIFACNRAAYFREVAAFLAGLRGSADSERDEP